MAELSSLPEDETDTTTSFWNRNIPPARRTTQCPTYLLYALTNDKDRAILNTPDTGYRRQSWPEVLSFIRANRLDCFQRVPSDLRRYREYCAKIVEEHGSIMKFILAERVKWQNLDAKGAPFEDVDDYRVLLNDWPYGLDLRIKHLVVWTKFSLPEDPVTGDLTFAARQATDDFVTRTFSVPCGRDRVIWFKNWASLKSIHAVEHLHVLLFDPPPQFVDDITHGDVALADKVRLDD